MQIRNDATDKVWMSVFNLDYKNSSLIKEMHFTKPGAVNHC